MDIAIVFSFNVWSKLNLLSQKERLFLLNKTREIIRKNSSQEQIQNLLKNKEKTLIKFSYDFNYKIVASLINSEDEKIVVKIVEFIDEQELNNSQYLSLINNLKIEEIDTFDENLEEDLDSPEINKNLIWQEGTIEINPDDFILKENDFWNYDISLKNDKYSDLLLSSEQYYILNKKTNLPLLLQANSGTGKTNLALYSALNHAYKNQENSDYQIFYVTSNQFLKRKIENLVNNITFEKVNNLIINDYQSLCKYAAEKYQITAKNQFLSQRQITYHKFVERFCNTKEIKNIDTLGLWQEIRHLIKGSNKSLSSSNAIISHNNYLASKSQSILPSDTDYNYVYQLASEYQNWLKAQNFWDELDITHYLLNRISQGICDEIYADDIQDLTELQLQLILRLIKVEKDDNYLPKFFLTGETEKIINHNGFRWNRLKKVIIDLYSKLSQWPKIRAFIEPKILTYNFYSSNTIIDLDSEIFNLAKQVLKSSNKIIHQSSFLQSETKPLIIFGNDSDILNLGQKLALDSAIIVFNKVEKEKLSNHFTKDKERILTIEEIDGLQFKQVLVWKLFSVFQGTLIDTKDFNALKYHYFSICTESTREKLYFYDDKINHFWHKPSIKSLITKGEINDLISLFTSGNSQEEITKIAENFVTKGKEKAYQIAIEIYNQAQDEIGTKKVQVLLEEEQGNWSKAGNIWNELFIFDEAIRCWNEVDTKLWEAKWASLSNDDWIKRGLYFEQKKDYSLANFCYEKADNFEGKLRCLEVNNQWELMADKCREKKDIERANKYYELADKYYQENNRIKSALKMWMKINKWDKAAVIWENSQQWDKAAQCWLKNGSIEKAAHCWENGENWEEAQKCWSQLENWQELAISYESEQKWDLAIETWQKMSQSEKVAECYQKSNQWDKAADSWRDLGYWGCVAIAFQHQGKWAEAALAWQKTNPIQQEALCYEQIQEWDKAEECWLKLRNWTKIILACQKQGKWQEAAESWENLGKWTEAAIAWQKIAQIENAAECYEEGNLWQKAEECWQKLNQLDRVALTSEKQGKWQEAAESWEKIEKWAEAGKAWEAISETEKAAECYEKGELWAEAGECWRLLDNWERAENASGKQGKWQKAANKWLNSNQIDKAALCYENCQDWAKAEKYWRQLNNWPKIANVCVQQNKWKEAAEAYFKSEEIEKAGECFEKDKNWLKAEECWRKLNKHHKIAQICEYLNKWQDAAESWLLVKEMAKAAECFEKVEDWAKAEECWRKTKAWERIGIVCEYQDKWEEAAQVWQFLSQWYKAAVASLKLGDTETAIKYYEKGEYWEEAKKYRNQLNN